MDAVDERGQPITADTLLVLMNAEPVPVAFVVPDADGASFWDVVVDTAEAGEPKSLQLASGETRVVESHTLVLLRRARRADASAALGG